MMAVGIGCRRGATGEEIVALVRATGERLGHTRLDLLAAPAFKREEDGIAAAAAVLGLPTCWIDDEALAAAAPRCPTRSKTALRTVGHASVAEASALAALGPRARLLAPRATTARVTCAFAVEDGP